MLTSERQICIILARSGSKRVQGKNQQKINGKSLIDYAVDCCIENDIKTILSSDSEEILAFYLDSQVVIHKRSGDTSTDHASSEDALREVLNFYNVHPETEVLLVPPTNPLRTSTDLKLFLEIWHKEAKPKGYDQAISVQAMHNDFWYFKKNRLERVRNIIFERVEPRVSKYREKIFLETSAIYLTSARLLYEGKSLIGSNPFPIELSKMAALDIDTEGDLVLARKLMF
jgi:CMP-N-acetylneuraminic acid synthetase